MRTVTFNGKLYSVEKLINTLPLAHSEQVKDQEIVGEGHPHDTPLAFKHEGKLHLILGNKAQVAKEIRVITKIVLKKADASAQWVNSNEARPPVTQRPAWRSAYR